MLSEDEDVIVEGIGKAFPAKDEKTGEVSQRLVIQDISFRVPKDRFVVLFGPNASGKTTLLKIIAGLLEPDNGSVRFPRKDFRVDLVFQNYRESLFPWKSVLDNIAFPLELRGVGEKARRDEAAELLKRIGSRVLRENEFSKYPYQLSGGQQQLVAFARSLIAPPDLLLMDECFAALDHDARSLMQDVLAKVWEEMDFRVVFISHSIHEAIYLADSIVLMSSRPSCVEEVIDVPIDRPRNREVESSRTFSEVRNRVLEVFGAISV